MKKKLTEALIDSEECQCPAGKDILEIFDTEQRGLVLRIYAGGSKAFWCRYSVGGRKVKFRLGDTSAISIKAARAAVAKAMGELAQGRDPAGERKATREAEQRKSDERAFTLRVLVDRWAAAGLKDARPSYRNEAPRALKVAFADRLDRAAADLTDKAVIKVKSALFEAEKDATASALLRYGHAAFAWAVSERLTEGNPFAGIKKPSVASRERILTDEELRAIWRATGAAGPFSAIVRVLMITGQRREEVAGMSWAELSGDLLVWSIGKDRAKNKVAHDVPLSPLARETIQGALGREGVDLVFPGERGTFKNWGHAKGRLDEACGVTGWRLHDLRRTVATGLQALGVRLEVTEAVLNHVSGSRAGVAGVYQRHDWKDEKRAALAAWSDKLAAIIEGRAAAANIHEFRRARA